MRLPGANMRHTGGTRLLLYALGCRQQSAKVAKALQSHLDIRMAWPLMASDVIGASHGSGVYAGMKRLLTSGMSRILDQSPVVGNGKPPGRGILLPFASRTSPPSANASLFFWSITIFGSI